MRSGRDREIQSSESHCHRGVKAVPGIIEKQPLRCGMSCLESCFVLGRAGPGPSQRVPKSGRSSSLDGDHHDGYHRDEPFGGPPGSSSSSRAGRSGSNWGRGSNMNSGPPRRGTSRGGGRGRQKQGLSSPGPLWIVFKKFLWTYQVKRKEAFTTVALSSSSGAAEFQDPNEVSTMKRLLPLPRVVGPVLSCPPLLP